MITTRFWIEHFVCYNQNAKWGRKWKGEGGRQEFFKGSFKWNALLLIVVGFHLFKNKLKQTFGSCYFLQTSPPSHVLVCVCVCVFCKVALKQNWIRDSCCCCFWLTYNAEAVSKVKAFTVKKKKNFQSNFFLILVASEGL